MIQTIYYVFLFWRKQKLLNMKRRTQNYQVSSPFAVWCSVTYLYFFFAGHSTFSSTRIIWLTTPYWIPKWQITHQSVSNTRDIRIHSIYLLFPCEHILLSLSFLWHYVQLLNGFLLLCGCDNNEVGWSSGMCNILHQWYKY